MRKVCGVGINDTEIAGPSCTVRDEFGKKTNYRDYSVWYGMLIRGFCSKFKKENPTYESVTVCDEWLVRSNFQKWFFAQTSVLDNNGSTLQLDKDLLVQGSKIYSPETCALVPQYLNVLFNEGVPKTDGLPMWVRYRQRNKDMKNDLKKPYSSAVSARAGKIIRLGYYENAEDAHFAAQAQKIAVIQSCLEAYRGELCYRKDVDVAVQARLHALVDDHQNKIITTRL